jgi:hypothetical protein
VYCSLTFIRAAHRESYGLSKTHGSSTVKMTMRMIRCGSLIASLLLGLSGISCNTLAVQSSR